MVYDVKLSWPEHVERVVKAHLAAIKDQHKGEMTPALVQEVTQARQYAMRVAMEFPNPGQFTAKVVRGAR